MTENPDQRRHAIAAIAKLALAFGKDLNKEQADLYLTSLRDLTSHQLTTAVNKVISNEKFFPAIATLRSAAFENDSEPSAEEAWGIVTERIQRQGRAAGARSLPELFQTAIGACGGWPALCESTNPTGDRITFVRAYASALQREQRTTAEAWIHPSIASKMKELSQGADSEHPRKLL
tara:strand:- start:12261 stop:12791 length:531 start_codon:yes stop_codon:yes gene_type:complete